jgi:hypothetical protein
VQQLFLRQQKGQLLQLRQMDGKQQGSSPPLQQLLVWKQKGQLCPLWKLDGQQ